MLSDWFRAYVYQVWC